jgi:hypothetical protein
MRRLLSSDRALPCDILYFARKIPMARVEISLDLLKVAEQRSAVQPRISWSALFLKAFGLVAERQPCLRQSYMAWPIPHVYQHQSNVAMVAVHRELAGCPRLCWGRVIEPGKRRLRDIQIQLDRYAQQPVEQVFRKQLQLSRLPWPLRRLAWWTALNVSGRVRQRQVGTFSMSSLAGQGVNNRDHPSLCTCSLTYGPLDRNGGCLVTLVYDHRLLDGMQAAQALQNIGVGLQSEILNELRQLAHRRRAA